MITSDVSNHDCATVATQTVFEQSSQFTITVRNVVRLIFRAVLVKCINAVTKCQKRPVNIGTLDHPHAAVVGLGGSLGAGEVNK